MPEEEKRSGESVEKPAEKIELPEKLREEVKSQSAEFSAPAKPKRKGLFWLILILIIIIVAAGGYIAYGKYGPQINKLLGIASDQSSNTSNSSDSAKKAADTTATKDAVVEKVVDDGVTWQTPTKLADLGLFRKDPNFEGLGEYQGTNYYQVATTATGGQIIVAEVSAIDTAIYRFIKRNGLYYLITLNSPKVESGSGYLSDKFTPDTSYFLKSLAPDKSITKGETLLVYQIDGAIENKENMTTGNKIVDTKWGGLYLEQGKAFDTSSGTASTARYFIKMNDSTKAYYDPKPTFLRDDRTMDVTFTNTANAKITFDKMKTSGCGFGVATFPLAISTALGVKVQVATSTAGTKLYSFTSATDPLAKYAYSVYTTGQETLKPIGQFLADYGILIWIDDYGNATIYSNSNYAPLAECGKPVIYLYPTKPTQVSVKVGANITKSDPEYKNGWNVLADPSGLLTTDFGLRTDLFWEGLGWGQYPEIISGSIVESVTVKDKITADLTRIGLNTKKFQISWISGCRKCRRQNTPA